jgi:hypothetical protein
MKRFGNESWLQANRLWVVWVTGVGRIGYRQRPGAGWYRRPALCLGTDRAFFTCVLMSIFVK